MDERLPHEEKEAHEEWATDNREPSEMVLLFLLNTNYTNYTNYGFSDNRFNKDELPN